MLCDLHKAAATLIRYQTPLGVGIYQAAKLAANKKDWVSVLEKLRESEWLENPGELAIGSKSYFTPKGDVLFQKLHKPILDQYMDGIERSVINSDEIPLYSDKHQILIKEAGWVDQFKNTGALSDKSRAILGAASEMHTARPSWLLSRLPAGQKYKQTLDSLSVQKWYEQQYRNKGLSKKDAFLKARDAVKNEALKAESGFRGDSLYASQMREAGVPTPSLGDVSTPGVLIRNPSWYNLAMDRMAMRVRPNKSTLYAKYSDDRKNQFIQEKMNTASFIYKPGTFTTEQTKKMAEDTADMFAQNGGGVTNIVPGGSLSTYQMNPKLRMNGLTKVHEARELLSGKKHGLVGTTFVKKAPEGYVVTGGHNTPSVVLGDEAMMQNMPAWNNYPFRQYSKMEWAAAKRPPDLRLREDINPLQKPFEARTLDSDTAFSPYGNNAIPEASFVKI